MSPQLLYFDPGSTATSVELRRFLQDKVASFKVPRRIVIRDQLPKGITGKVQRRRLAESWDDTPAASGQTQAIASTDNTTTQDTLVKGLLAVWERLLKTSPLTIDDDFFEKGGNSLLATDMLFEVEALTGQTIPSSILFEATTIRQLAEVLSQSGGLQQKYLSKMNASGQRRPLIYFHGHFNAFGRHAITLANILGPDQPLFVVAPHGTGKELIPDSIEAMAADRLPLILEAQPDGPYRLGGQCLGGIIAFEVARMLVDAGKEVEMVVMVDPPTINARKTVQSLFSTMRSTRPIFGTTVDQAMAWTWFRGVQLAKISELFLEQARSCNLAAIGFAGGKSAWRCRAYRPRRFGRERADAANWAVCRYPHLKICSGNVSLCPAAACTACYLHQSRLRHGRVAKNKSRPRGSPITRHARIYRFCQCRGAFEDLPETRVVENSGQSLHELTRWRAANDQCL